ncbi:MAG: bifunctional phosphoribosyl-AMP cyclohydrolase/phosphoribosyl-ATP diphosphatase HisIE [Clostridia bacterium]|nr:bifunctional phosphoribosyl-AMP cyclohydrolase/phosphoribosyl-ATP diphosphatase HisIE [Clostridia bacterium]
MKALIDINELKFDEKGLIPAIITDEADGAVLMLGYMNAESLRKTLETGLVCFFSRARQTLWTKGETSGNFLRVKAIKADCDKDSLLVSAAPDGPACHTGAKSCFFNPVCGETEEKFTLESLSALIADRKTNKKEGSYTTYLFEKGLDKILKKVGEESTEVIIAAKGGDRRETVYEIADLTYHLLVLMEETGISAADIKAELASRHVIDKKIKQEKPV